MIPLWYVGTEEPYMVELIDPLPDAEGMVKVRRIRDGMECWVYPYNLEEHEAN